MQFKQWIIKLVISLSIVWIAFDVIKIRRMKQPPKKYSYSKGLDEDMTSLQYLSLPQSVNSNINALLVWQYDNVF
jgi:hypothetical protein